MFIAKVLKTVTASEKHPIFNGEKLLIVRRVREDGVMYGVTIIAIDRAQAGVGDKVLVLQEGSSCRFILGSPIAPVQCIIVGVVDHVQL